MTVRRLFVLSVCAAVAAVALIAIAARTGEASAQDDIDLSGTWRIGFFAIGEGGCTSVVEQDGDSLVSIAECSIVSMMRLTGTFDKASRTIDLVDPSLLSLHGVVSEDGNTIEGTFDAMGFLSGPFTAIRDDTIELFDLSSGWRFAFISSGETRCDLTIEPSLAETTGQLNCPDTEPMELVGWSSPLSGSVYFYETTDPADRVFLDGAYHRGGRYLEGRARIAAAEGTFIAVREGEHESGVVAADCRDFPGVQIDCSRDVGEPFMVQIYYVLQPDGGYASFDLALSSVEGLVEFQGTTTTACSGSSQSHLDQGSITIGCASARAGYDGPLASITAECERGGEEVLALSGTELSNSVGHALSPLLIDLNLLCFGSRAGDATCDGSVNSVDAALVLQYDARLLPLNGCLAGADLNRDDLVNSIDASIILQCSAGLTDMCG